MITNLFSRFALITLGVSLIFMVGCASTEPSRFYILHSLPDSEAKTQIAAAENGVAIGIGPIELPEYLDRPQIVTRLSKNELQLAEFDQWVEPLNHNLPRVLAENLSILLSTDRVFAYPWTGSAQIDYQVAVEVTRFDGTLGGDVLLNTRWSLLAVDEKKVLVKKKSTFRQSTGGVGYDSLVSAKSQVLADLSREIAEEIKAHLKDATER